MPKDEICPKCSGSGYHQCWSSSCPDKDKICKSCNGTGHIPAGSPSPLPTSPKTDAVTSARAIGEDNAEGPSTNTVDGPQERGASSNAEVDVMPLLVAARKGGMHGAVANGILCQLIAEREAAAYERGRIAEAKACAEAGRHDVKKAEEQGAIRELNTVRSRLEAYYGKDPGSALNEVIEGRLSHIKLEAQRGLKEGQKS